VGGVGSEKFCEGGLLNSPVVDGGGGDMMVAIGSKSGAVGSSLTRRVPSLAQKLCESSKSCVHVGQRFIYLSDSGCQNRNPVDILCGLLD
jgi:hypothetical protein